MPKKPLSRLFGWYCKRITENPKLAQICYDAFQSIAYHERLRLAGVRIKLNPDATEFILCAALRHYTLGKELELDRLPMSLALKSDCVDVYLRGWDDDWYILYPFEYILIPPDASKEASPTSPGSQAAESI